MIEYKTTVAPAVEPVSLAELRQHLRIYAEITDDDAYIQGLAKVAREKLEATVCRSFITRTIEARLKGFPGEHMPHWTPYERFPGPSHAIMLLYPPLQSVTSITYVDTDGATQTLDPADYEVIPGTPGYVSPAVGKSWPSALDRPGSVKVTFTAGEGDDADAVPETAKLIIKLATALFYEQRLPVVMGTIVAKMPFALEAMTDILRWGCYP